MLREMLLISVLCFGLQTVLACYQKEQYPVPYNCREYNECVDGYPVRRECNLGYYYDGKKCDLLSNVNCKIEECTNGKTFKRGDCIQDYDICVLGKVFKQSCPSGSSFNGQECVSEERCKNNGIKTKAVQQQSVIKVMARTNVKECKDGEKRNHPTDCSMFELCVDGQWIDRSCPWLEHFDINTLNCAYWTYTCNYGHCNETDKRSIYGRCSEYDECHNGRWTTMKCHEGTYYQDGSCQNKPCPLRPILNNCSYFMEPGSNIKYECPPKELFDKVERQCVPEKDAKCLVGECEDGDKTYVATDCKKYKLCQNGNWTEESCSFWTHFDINSKECSYFSYTCGHDEPVTTTLPVSTITSDSPSTTIKSTTTAPVKEKCDKEDEVRAETGDCKRYHICKDGQWTDNKCYLWGRFDTVTKECFYFLLWEVHCA